MDLDVANQASGMWIANEAKAKENENKLHSLYISKRIFDIPIHNVDMNLV